MRTRYLPAFSIRWRSRSATLSTMSFSVSPFGPLVPVSIPPWPGSRTTSDRASPDAAGGTGGAASARAGRVSSSARRKKLSRSVLVSSSDMRAGPPGAVSVTDAPSMRGGLGKSENDSRAAGHYEAEAKRLDEATSHVARFWRQAKRHLWQIDHHAIRIGKRERAQLGLAANFQDEAGLRIVAAETGVRGHRKRIGRDRGTFRRRFGGRGGCDKKER